MNLLEATAFPVGEWWGAVVRYTATALATYVIASVQFGKKLEKRDNALNSRLGDIERDVARLSSEVWGPHGESGLRKEVGELQRDVKEQTKTLGEILATVRLLAKQTGRDV